MLTHLATSKQLRRKHSQMIYWVSFEAHYGSHRCIAQLNNELDRHVIDEEFNNLCHDRWRRIIQRCHAAELSVSMRTDRYKRSKRPMLMLKI